MRGGHCRHNAVVEGLQDERDLCDVKVGVGRGVNMLFVVVRPSGGQERWTSVRGTEE